MVPPPSVKVGGKPYCVRFSNGAFYLLSTWGIDVTRLAATLNEYFQGGRYTDAMTKLAAAGLGNFDADGNWRSLGIPPLELADRLLDEEVLPLGNAVWEAFSGKLGLAKTTAGTAPAEESQKPDGSTSGPSESPGPVSD